MYYILHHSFLIGSPKRWLSYTDGRYYIIYTLLSWGSSLVCVLR